MKTLKTKIKVNSEFHAGCDHQMCWNLLLKQCYLSLAGSGGNTLMFLRRNLLTCLQAEISSVLLFRRLRFDVMMWKFPWRKGGRILNHYCMGLHGRSPPMI